jgi:hypothetical protein
LLLATSPDDYIWIPTTWLSYQYAEMASGIRNPTPLHQAILQMPSTPILLIAAGGDMATSQAYVDAADEPRTLWVRQEPGHQIDALFDQPAEYEQRVIGFLDQALLDRRGDRTP